MESLLRFTLVLLIGSGGQLVDGSLGMGFGVVSAASLLAAGFPPAGVVATVNVAKIVTGLLSGLSHWRVGNVRRDWLVPLIAPGVISGALGAYILASLPPEGVRFWMSVVLVGMGILILWRALSPTKETDGRGSDLPAHPGPSSGGHSRLLPYSRLRLSVLGLVAGFLNAISGAYGPFATSAVMLSEKPRPHLAVGTVSLAEPFVAGAAASTLLFNLGAHTFPWDLALALTLGSALTASLAAHICQRLPSRVLALGVGLALISLNLGVVVSWAR